MELTESQFKVARAITPALNQRSLELIILPTEQCNFRCTYCYEDFAVGRMSEAVQLSVLRFLSRAAPRLKYLSLGWFGGEPLLARDIVKRVSAHAQQLAREHGLAYFDGSLTTNGYFLKPMLFQELLDLQQTRYQISLDGFGDGHNATRKAASGAGTFDVIWNNLLATRRVASEFSILLRVHITPDNRESVTRLVDAIAESFQGDRRYRVFFKPVGDYGGPNAGKIRIMPLEQMVSFTPKLQAVLDSAGIANSSDAGGRAESDVGEHSVDAPEYICYASRPNSFMVRADGSIGKCTVALADARNAVGRLTPDGELELNEKLGLWLRGFKTLDFSVLQCPLLGLPSTAKATAVMS